MVLMILKVEVGGLVQWWSACLANTRPLGLVLSSRGRGELCVCVGGS